MKNFIVLGAFLALILGGCSAKEFNAGADGIGNDIKNAFEGSRDTSAK